MANLRVTEIKAFVPTADYSVSKQFYQDLGFTMASEGGGVAYFRFEHVSFLLQDGGVDSTSPKMTMHLLVEDVDAWWDNVERSKVVEVYGVSISPIETQPWKMRDFYLSDPSGIVWCIAQNID